MVSFGNLLNLHNVVLCPGFESQYNGSHSDSLEALPFTLQRRKRTQISEEGLEAG